MRRLVTVAVVALLALPASAIGATRYASPEGDASGSCAQSEPCSLAYAITAAGAGDEVVVGPGLYEVAATIEATVPLSIHGGGVQSWPRIVGANGVTPLKSGERLALSYLSIESTEAGTGTVFAYADGDVFDHLELIANGSGGLALRPGVNWTLTDSLLFARGESSSGLFVQGAAAGTSTMRNDTVVAEGPETMAISITGLGPFEVGINATNVISIGETAASTNNNSGSTTFIAFDHSDLQGSTEGGVTSVAAQTAPPKFVDAATGNFREAPGSPTIDSGVNDPANGATDLDGNPRALPGAITCAQPNPPAVTDIGAYEFIPAAPTCAPPSSPPPSLNPKPKPHHKPKQHHKQVGPPDTSLIKVVIKGRTAKFRFAATGGVATGFECKLDRKPWRKCTSPRKYRHLKRGIHTFRVRAVFKTGPDPTPAKRRFKIHRPRRHLHHHRVG